MANILTAQQASFEDGTTTGITVIGGTVVNSTAAAAHGTSSLLITADGSGNAEIAINPRAPVVGGNTYSFVFTAKAVSGAAGTPWINYRWYDAAGVAIGSLISSSSGSVTTSFGQVSSLGVVAPSNAASVHYQPRVFGAAGQQFYMDKLGVLDGTTSTWTLPTGPRSIQGLKVWLEADTITGLSDGAAVSTWPDDSRYNHPGAQATGASQPLYKTGQVNGLPAVKYDGSNDQIDIANHAELKSAKFTAFYYVRTNDGSTGSGAGAPPGSDDTLGVFTSTTSWNDGWGIRHLAAGTATLVFWINNWNNASLAQRTDFTTATWHTVMVRYDQVNASLRIDGNQTDTAYTTAVTYPATAAMSVGAAQATYALPIDLAEFLFYDRELTTAEVAVIESYLTAKYGSAAATPITASDAPTAAYTDASAVKSLPATTDAPTAALTETSSVYAPNVTVELWENGVFVATLGNYAALVENVLSASFNMTALADPSGAGAEIRITGVSADIAAVEWNATYANIVVSSGGPTLIATTDVPTMGYTEGTSVIAATLATTDVPTMAAADVSTVLASLSRTDAPTASYADVSAVATVITTTDLPTLSYADTSAVAGTVSVTDAATLSFDTYEGSANLLTVNQATIEISAAGWSTSTNAPTVAQSTTVSRSGAASLSMTATAAGPATMAALTGIIPITAGKSYTVRAYVRSAATVRNVGVQINWYSALGGGYINTATGTQVPDNTSGWTLVTVTAVAPANAVGAQVVAYIPSTPVAGETHYYDDFSLTETTTPVATTLTASDPPTMAYTETSAPLAAFSSTDVPTVSYAEVSLPAVAQAAVDAPALATTDVSTSFAVVVPTTDAPAMTVWENPLPLTVDQMTIETSATGWTGNSSNVTVSRTTAFSYEGVASLMLTSLAAGTMFAKAQPATSIPASPGQVWTLMAWFRADTVPRNCELDIIWRDSGGAIIGQQFSVPTMNSTSGWTLVTVTGTAPALTAFVNPMVQVDSTAAAGEVHYVDRILLLKPNTVVGTMVTTDNPWLGLYEGLNVLTANQSSLEAGVTTGWAVNQNCVLAATQAASLDGAWSLLMTATVAATAYCNTLVGVSGFPVIAGATYNGLYSVKLASGPGRAIGIYFSWYTAAGAFISSTSGPGATTSTTWQELMVSATAPATAAFGGLNVQMVNPQIGDALYIDRAAVYANTVATSVATTDAPTLSLTDVSLPAASVSTTDVLRAVATEGLATNLLTANQSGLETDLTGWATETNATVARSTSEALDGTASLQVTVTATGNAVVRIPFANAVPVTPGVAYIQEAWFKKGNAAYVGRPGAQINWSTAGGAYISSTSSGLVTTTDTGWTRSQTVGVAPPTAAWATPGVVIQNNPGAGEVHYGDRFAAGVFTDTISTVLATTDPPTLSITEGTSVIAGAVVAVDAPVLDLYEAPNLYTANQSSFETDTTGWGGSNCTVARDTTQAFDGGASMRLTNSVGGVGMWVTGPSVSGVVPGQVYSGYAWFKPATHAVTQVFTVLTWLDAASGFLSNSVGIVAEVLGQWVKCPITAVAPAGAAKVRIQLNVQDATQTLGEQHYIDKVWLSQAPAPAVTVDTTDTPTLTSVDLPNPVATLNTDFDVNVSGWSATGSSSIAQTTAQSYNGTGSLQITSTAASTMFTQSGNKPVVAGMSYTATARVRAATVGRQCQITIRWYDAGSVQISNATGSSVLDTTSGWSLITTTGVAPANATQAALYLTVQSVGSIGEVHYLDAVTMLAATNTVTVTSTTTDLTLIGLEEGQQQLTPNQQSIEIDFPHWSAESNCVLFRSTTQSFDGSFSLGMTVNASTTQARAIVPNSGPVDPVCIPGQVVTVSAWVKSATASRIFHIEVRYGKTDSSFVSGAQSPGVASSTTGWTKLSLTTSAPAGTERVRLKIDIDNPVAGEIHYVDLASITIGNPIVSTLARSDLPTMSYAELVVLLKLVFGFDTLALVGIDGSNITHRSAGRGRSMFVAEGSDMQEGKVRTTMPEVEAGDEMHERPHGEQVTEIPAGNLT